MLCRRRRCIFIHVPRTGGTSVSKILHPGKEYEIGGPNRPKHWPIDRYDPETVNELFTFAFVRNPWDLMVSVWKILIRWGRLPPTLPFPRFVWYCEPILEKAIHRTWDRAFLELVRHGQLWWIKPDQGGVDFVGRYERLATDFAVVARRIGLETDRLPHVNGTRHRAYQRYYDARSREVVQIRFRRDIEVFGYSFEDSATDAPSLVPG